MRDASNRVHLTERLIRTATATGQQSFFRDDTIPGFGLRVSRTGKRSFILEMRIRGRPRRVTLGPHPALSLDAARRVALEKLAAVAKGYDPAEENAARRREITFGELATRYLDGHARLHKKASSAAEDARMLNGSYFEALKPLKLSQITRARVAQLQQDIANRQTSAARWASKPADARPRHHQANRCIALLRCMMNKATEWGLLDGPNPTKGIKLFKERSRDRFLSDDELRAVLGVLNANDEEVGPDWCDFFKLSLLLGTRRGELLSLRWENVDLVEGRVLLPETKGGGAHVLPLPADATAVLAARARAMASPFVFPGTARSGHLTDPHRAWSAVCERAGISGVRIHDLRRTVGARLACRGHSLHLIGRTLNHSDPATTKIYARLSLAPVRAALDENAEGLAKLMSLALPADGEDSPTSMPTAPTPHPGRILTH